MSRIASLGGRRNMLLVLVLVLAGAALFLVPPQPAQASVCNPNLGVCSGSDVIYYNNAKHGKQVGECDCDDCTGEQTAFFVVVPICCPCD